MSALTTSTRRWLVALALAGSAACAGPDDGALATRAAALEECPLDDVDLGTLPPLPTTPRPPIRLPPDLCDDDGCAWEEDDDIYGVDVPRASSWWVHEGFIYRGKERVKVRGVSWFGFETKDVAPHGLWAGRSVPDTLDQMMALGFDAIRLPLSPEAYREGFIVPDWAQEASGIATARELLLHLLAEAEERDFHVLLDLHTCAHGVEPPPGTPTGCPGYTLASWHDDLRLLADLAAQFDNVLGIEMYNEPYDLLWGEWADLASDAAKVVLKRNPRVLVFVQGASWRSAGAAYDVVHGESLVHAAVYPPDIPASRLVYAPHAYGPDVWQANYLSSDQYPDVLEHVWDLRFGHLFTAGHGMVMGEFGGHYDDDLVEGSVDWQDRFVDWMRARGLDSFFYWCWNPNSGNTGGILEEDWETPDADKLRLLAPLLAD